VPQPQKRRAEIRLADYEAQIIEGRKRSDQVASGYPSEEAAMAGDNGPAHEAAKKICPRSCAKNNPVLAR
jgi:hypothetical protein